MKTKLNLKQLDELTPKRALTLAIIAIVVLVVLYFVYKKIKAIIQTKAAEAKLKLENSQYGEPTLSTTQIASLAQQIYNAFVPSIWNWGTDEAVVERVLSQLNNNADYAALYIAYQGVNRDPKTDLNTRIQYEGTKAELRKWRSILDAKGITIYTF